VVVNRNANWLDDKASWAVYLILILITWLALSCWTDPGMAWTYTHIVHGVLSWYILHWIKGSPIQEDQGKYDRCAPPGRVPGSEWACADTSRRRAPTSCPPSLACAV
jgi:hypothetical protein